jgi:AcrR family transcriptional regulator
MSVKKRPLSRERILDAALHVLDQGGLEKLSMRSVAAALGVEAMSLYNHVDGKAALLDGIHERILAGIEEPARARTWQAYARHQAHALHRALLAHPNAIPLFATRPASTPASIAQLDRWLDVLRRAGFTPLDALSVVQLLLQLVVGHAMWTTAPEVGALYDEAPPRVKELADVLGEWDSDRELDMGIEALLVGFAARL